MERSAEAPGSGGYRALNAVQALSTMIRSNRTSSMFMTLLERGAVRAEGDSPCAGKGSAAAAVRRPWADQPLLQVPGPGARLARLRCLQDSSMANRQAARAGRAWTVLEAASVPRRASPAALLRTSSGWVV